MRCIEANTVLYCRYSIARSLHEAPGLADAVAAALKLPGPAGRISEAVWDALWPQEKQRQVPLNCMLLHSQQQLVRAQ